MALVITGIVALICVSQGNIEGAIVAIGIGLIVAAIL